MAKEVTTARIRELQAANFTCSNFNGADNKVPRQAERQRQRLVLSLSLTTPTSLPACVQKLLLLLCRVVCIKGRTHKRSARERKRERASVTQCGS